MPDCLLFRSLDEQVFTTINPGLFTEGFPHDFAVRGEKYKYEVLERKMAADLLEEMQVAQSGGIFKRGSEFFVLSAFRFSMRACGVTILRCCRGTCGLRQNHYAASSGSALSATAGLAGVLDAIRYSSQSTCACSYVSVSQGVVDRRQFVGRHRNGVAQQALGSARSTGVAARLRTPARLSHDGSVFTGLSAGPNAARRHRSG